MPNLFSPLTIGGRELPNRIVLAPVPSGLATADGFAGPELAAFYARRARGGVGLIISEPVLVAPPSGAPPHLGGYADVFVPSLRHLVAGTHAHNCQILFTLDAPTDLDPADAAEAYLLAAWRAHCAGADGVMLSAADGGLLHQLISPLRNTRSDGFGGDLGARLQLATTIIERTRTWIGRRLLVGFRLVADELTPGGLGLQDARVVAKRVTAAGARLLDVAAPADMHQVASFPGWAVPLANAIKRITDVPVIGSGLLGDPLLADSIISDGSVDLVMLGRTLHSNPDWPQAARMQIARERRAGG